MKNILSGILFLLAMCAGLSQVSAKTWYVGTWSGKGAQDVKATVQEAIDGAAAGDQVWIAKGSYLLAASVTLKDGVSLYGGFVGDEAALTDRVKTKDGQPWEYVNETILNGDTRKFIILNQTGDGFAKDVVIEGLTITGGSQGVVLGKKNVNTIVRNCIVKENGNIGTGDGGGLGVTNACLVEYCLVENNRAKNGGGIAINGGSGAQISYCTVRNNDVVSGDNNPTKNPQGWGGGIFNNAGFVSNCIIIGNKAVSGGGLLVRTTSALNYNCLIANNEAYYGGGVTFDGRNGTIYAPNGKVCNSTIVSNLSTKDGAGGVYFTNNGQTLINSIVWNNKLGSELLSASTISGKTYSVENCALQAESGNVTGQDNIRTADSTQLFAAGGWLPASNSLGIDKGQPVAGLPATDLAGNLRITGRSVDIGAYEKLIDVKPGSGDIFYVKGDAKGGYTGASWDDALLDVGVAVAAAKVYNDKNSKKAKVWVAAGTYVINVPIALYDGISVYGGFKGTEKSETEREMIADGAAWDFKNPTILDAAGECGIFVQSDHYKAFGTVVDGFTCQNGSAVSGGGISMMSNGTTQNCRFIDCSVTASGGGLFVVATTGFNSQARIYNNYFKGCKAKDGGGFYINGYSAGGEASGCVVEKCEASNFGGGIFTQGYILIQNNVVRNNKAAVRGGGIYARVKTNVIGCLVTGNTAPTGGGIVTMYDNGSGTDCRIVNNTIARNTSTASAGGYVSMASSTKKTIYLVNNVFWKNSGKDGEGQMTMLAGMAHKVQNNAIEGQTDFTGTADIAYTDCMTLNGADSAKIFGQEYSLTKTSPCVNAGNNTMPSVTLPTTDVTGNLRVVKGTVDIGAYEYSASAGLKPDAKGIFYVKIDGTGTGGSWANAAGDIEAVLGAAFKYQTEHSDMQPQVWVGGGTYLLEFPVKLYDKVNVYGGFAGTETEVAQRAKVTDGKPWEFVNATIIDAQKKCGAFEQSASYTDEATTLDGFTIQNGKAADGGGILFVTTSNSKAGTVQNCQFINCEATGNGGAIRMNYQGNITGCYFTECKAGSGGAIAAVQYNGNINVTGCEIIGNSSTNRGGGIYLMFNGKITNCLVMNNSCEGVEANYGGGGGINFRIGGTIMNSVIANNTARRGGGVMGAYDNSGFAGDMKIINSTIANNTAKENGGGVYRNSAHTTAGNHKKLTVTNTVFWNNKLNDAVSHVQTFRPEVDELVNSALNGESGTLEGIRTDNQVLADSVSNFGEGWTLKETSVCVDNGVEIAGLPDTDFYGKNRKSGLSYDIGACEYQSKFDFRPSDAGIFYVKQAEEQGIGNSWNSPITEVVYAMQAAKSYKEKNPKKSVQVWIAGGTYNVPSAMTLVSGVNVYGGFAGTETAADQRVKVTGGKAWDYQNETVLDGQSKTQIFTQAADFTEQTYVDGLTVKNAKTSSSHGAAMYLKGKTTVQYCKFIDCEAVGKNGGAINVATCKDTKILYSYFYGNKASNGGSIFTESDNPVIDGCWVEKSSALARGGGIYVYQATVFNSVIINNHCDGNDSNKDLGGGGGLYGRDGGKFFNCIVTGNTANQGAGIMSGGNAGYSFVTTVANCVIADNMATENGGGVHASPSKVTYGMKVYNTVFWNNTLNGRANHKMERTQLFNSAVQNGDGIESTDEECINITDKAVSFTDNWEPKDGSACLDKGKSDVEGMPATDIAGNKRISNGKVDMGAYEYQNPADDFAIDFVNEKLSYVPDAAQVVECSAAQGFGEVSAFSDLITKESRKIYIRLQSDQAKIVAFDVPGRGVPAAAIDFTGDSLKLVSAGSTWDIAQSGVFAEITDKSLTVYIDGGGKTGVVLRQPATDKTFKTDAIFDIPGRLDAPAGLTLNYVSESLEGMEDLAVLEAKTTGKYAGLSDASIRNLIPTLGATQMTVRLKATDKDFASSSVDYTLPARPAMTAFSINFETAETKESIPSTVEIDTVATFAYAVRGADALMALEPGETYWFRVAASQEAATFASLNQKLIVPARPDMESVVIDFLEEKLIGLPKGAVWDYDGTTAEQAKEDISTLIPESGTRTFNIYVNMSDTTFASAAYDLVIPARPNVPAEISLDFRQETLSSALTGLEVKKDASDYADFRNQSVTPLVPQTGSVTMTMRKKATEEQFASKDTTFTLLPRPSMPGACTVDYVGEQTQEQIASGLEYASDSLAAVWTAAQDVPGVLMPGKIFCLRVASSQEAQTFASLMWSMKVPVRPEISIHDMEVTFRADSAFVPEMWNSWTNTAEEIVLESSNSRIAVAEENTLTLKSIGECDITATRIAREGEYFAAEPKTVTLTVKGANGETGNEEEPVVRDLYIANGAQDMNFRIEDERVDGCSLVFFNRAGKVIFESRSYGNDFNMGNLNAGTYYYVLTYDMNGRQNVKKGFVEIVR